MSRRTPSTRRLWALLLVLVRVVTVLFTLQFGGLIHDGVDIVSAVSGEESEHERCPPDGPCDECPIGCPNCHCTTPVRPAAPLPAIELVTRGGVRPLALLDLYDTQAPDGPDLPSIFRPPRERS